MLREKILGLLRETDGFLSGQELCEKFGVSRTSIWKAIRQLEEKGYQIEAVRNRGYHLLSEPDLLNGEQIRPYLCTEWVARDIRVYDSVDSTNSEAKRAAEDGCGQGLLILGEEQTAGKGRRGRYWASGKGEGVFMTLLLKPDIDPGNASMLTLIMGMAVRDAIEKVTGLEAQIKWPNDIVCDGKKICGILTEMSAQIDYINHIVIGVGINVHNREFPPDVQSVATSVYQQTGKKIRRAQLAAEVMNCFENYYNIYLQTENMKNLQNAYNTHLINRGRRVRVSDLKKDFTGMARGINEKGELLVETEDGLTAVSAGEVSVRGVYGYV